MSRKKDKGTKLRVEGLENRLMLNGNVVSALAGGLLTLTGDANDNGVLITSTGVPGQFTVRGFGDTAGDQAAYQSATGENLGGVAAGLTAPTTVDGVASKTFNGVTDIRVNVLQGSDLVIVGDGEYVNLDSLDVNMGFGAATPDRLLMYKTACLDAPGLRIDFNGGGAAVNKAWLGSVGSLDHVNISGSDAADEFYMDDVLASKNFKVLADSGDDMIYATGVEVGRNLVVKGQGNKDSIDLNNLEVGQDLRVLGNAGRDQIGITDACVDRDILVRGDGGSDNITIREVCVDGLTFVNLGGTAHDDVALIDCLCAKDDVFLNAGGGNDDVTISRSDIGGPTNPTLPQNDWDDLAVAMGFGNDILRIEQVWAWSVAADGGGGAGDVLDTTGTTVFSWADVWVDVNFETRNINLGDVMVGTQPGTWLV